jgi:phosphate:Na+ symporter
MICALVQVVGDTEPLDVALIVTTLLGGLALFLIGLDRMTDSLKMVAGHRMRTLLSRLTRNRAAGALTGAGVTAVIQSSSVTTVMVVGFVTSGLMGLSQAIPVIMGANVGTTITAQVIAFEVTKFALAIVAFGFVLSFFPRHDTLRAWGNLTVGLGLVFYGMTVMGDAMEPLRTNEAFIDAMGTMDNPLFGIVAGAAFTALIQSSSATTGVVIVLAAEGILSLDAGIALILGANVGTSVTAQLAAIGKPREALRASVTHTFFNVVGVLLWLPLIGVLASLTESIGGPVARQVANAHTIFNVANLFVFIWFVPQIARAVERIVPARPELAEAVIRAKYLDEELLRTPALALDRARRESLRMATRVRTMLVDVFPAVLDGPGLALLNVEHMDDEVDALQGQIVTYLGRVSKSNLSERSTRELVGLMEAVNDLEAIGDIIETSLVNLGLQRLDQEIVVSDTTRRVLTEYHDAVLEAYDLAIQALGEKEPSAVTALGAMKRDINEMDREAQAHEARRLTADAPKRVATYRLETDLIAYLKRIYYFTKRIGRTAVPPELRKGV